MTAHEHNDDVARALSEKADHDLEQYRNKERLYEAELVTLRGDIADAEIERRRIDDRIETMTHRRADVTRHLQAARAAKRALEDEGLGA